MSLLGDEKAKEAMYIVPLLVLSALSLLVDLLVGDSELLERDDLSKSEGGDAGGQG